MKRLKVYFHTFYRNFIIFELSQGHQVCSVTKNDVRIDFCGCGFGHPENFTWKQVMIDFNNPN